jgi:hypothetical protein
MHTPSRPLVAAALALLLAIPAFAQISLTLVNPGFESAVSAGFPTTAGNWQGDLNTAVTTQTGVTPFAGSQMLSFEKMSPDGLVTGTGSDTFQLVDLSAYAGSIAAGNFTVTLSAYFNRSDTTYNEFQTRIVSFSGSMANFQTDFQTPSYTANQFSSLASDANTATWELSSVSLTLPTNTTYIAVMVSAISTGNILNYPTGYYADNVTLTAVPEPSTYAVLAGLGALGLAAWRRRKAPAA